MQKKSSKRNEISAAGSDNTSALGHECSGTGLVSEIKKFATHDGPGIRTTVFFKGCPLKCKWCSNPETISPHIQFYFIAKRCKSYGACVDVCPVGAITMDKESKIDREKCTLCMECVGACPHGSFRQIGTYMSIDDVLGEIEKDKPFYGEDGGMTLSGGEPLYQPGFALCLLKRCHDKGISTVLDTCGYASPEIVKKTMDYTDMVLLDLKHMDTEMHKQGTGVDNALILENARFMAEKTRVRISLPLIPDFNDSKKNLSETAQFALSLGIDHIDVNPLHILGSDKYTCLGLNPPYASFRGIEDHEVLRARDILEGIGMQVTIGRMM